MLCSHKRNDEKTNIPASICIGNLFSRFKSKCQLKKKKKILRISGLCKIKI